MAWALNQNRLCRRRSRNNSGSPKNQICDHRFDSPQSVLANRLIRITLLELLGDDRQVRFADPFQSVPIVKGMLYGSSQRRQRSFNDSVSYGDPSVPLND